MVLQIFPTQIFVYLTYLERKNCEQAKENCTVGNFIICTLHHIKYKDDQIQRDEADEICNTNSRDDKGIKILIGNMWKERLGILMNKREDNTEMDIKKYGADCFRLAQKLE